jgi:hypothetical protein
MTHHVKPEIELEHCPASLVLSLKTSLRTHICTLGDAA